MCKVFWSKDKLIKNKYICEIFVSQFYNKNFLFKVFRILDYLIVFYYLLKFIVKNNMNLSKYGIWFLHVFSCATYFKSAEH